MTEIAALGLRVDGVQNVDKASASLDNLSTSSDKAQKSTDGLAGASKKSSRDVESLAESSKQAAGGVDGLATVAKRAAGIMVAAFGTIKLTSLIKDVALANSRFEQLGTVMEVVGRNVGLSSDQINKYAKEVQAMGISMTESRETVIRMVQAQMDLSKASELARLAQDAAVIANTNSSDALGRLIYGLQSGQVEILRTMGLNVNFANSYTALAKEMGVAVDELSEADKAQARTNAVMQAGVQIAGAYEASMDSASKQLGSTTRYVQDLGVMIGGVFSDTTKQLVFDYSDSLKELHSTVTSLSEDGSLERWSKNLASAINAAMINVKGFTAVAVELGKEAKGTADNIGVLAGAFRSVGIELPRMESVMRRVKEEMQDAALWVVFLAKSGLNALTGNLKGTASAWKELQEALKDRSAERQAERLDRLLVDTTKRVERFGAVVAESASSANSAKEANDKLAESLKKILDRLYPLQARARELSAELGILRQAAKDGLIDPSALDDWYEKNLMIATSIREEMVPAVDEMAAQANPLAESWQEALNRIDNAFVDLWKSAFNGFKDFADSLKNAFIQLLAELAHRATTQKILVSLGFTAGSGGAMAGGVGGAGGGLMSNIFSAGSWISAGKTLWQGFSGLATGQGLSGFSGLFGGHAANSALIPQHMLTRAASQQAAAMTNFTNTVGPILAGIGGAIQGWQTGNKANAVTGAVGGWGGAKLGASYGSTFGPIGTAVGAVIGGILGSALGSSVFGSGWQDRRQGIQLGFGEEGLMLEEWTRQTKKGGWFGSTRRRYIYSEMDEALASEFQTGYDAMIDVLGTQFLAIGADLDRAVFEGVKIGSASINTSDQTEEQIQEQIEKWFNDLNAAMIKGALNAAGDTSAAVRLLRATGGDSAMLEALGGLMGVAGSNAVQQARDAQTQLSMVDSYRAVTDATRTLIGEYDGSLEATLGLTEAMAIQQEMAFGLATAYLQASDAVGALFGNLKESIRTSLMGAEELYEYQRGQVHSLTDMLSTLSDPEAILRTSQEIERLVSGMWGRLDEDQRSTLGDEFLDYLDRTEALAQDRLAQGLAELESTQSDIYSALTSQMNDVADRMIETANRMQEAANLQWQSALQFGAYVSQMGGILSNIGQGQEQNA